ncbi:hypothetical protein PBY51_022916 [Eleginops maclovinus]|uniref:Uncharacterized protein n=1 Tax=Eleginops maclovinus TaxID=56733 RepID=A0AAN7XIU7_ELEMC|nr:hypothetical protein PBY51_022916 [Eleginops maclovinus]
MSDVFPCAPHATVTCKARLGLESETTGHLWPCLQLDVVRRWLWRADSSCIGSNLRSGVWTSSDQHYVLMVLREAKEESP